MVCSGWLIAAGFVFLIAVYALLKMSSGNSPRSSQPLEAIARAVANAVRQTVTEWNRAGNSSNPSSSLASAQRPQNQQGKVNCTLLV